jgi:NAD(P)-dependent dehydrogenase (short-subunit alcohol dehydrogenase family)
MGDHAVFAELLRALAREGARTLVVGGLAKKLHGEASEAHDQCLWYDADDENARRVYRALSRVGAELDGIAEQDLADVDYEFRHGNGDSEICLFGGLDGVTFADAWVDRLETRWRDVPLCVIGRETLRTTDLAERP